MQILDYRLLKKAVSKIDKLIVDIYLSISNEKSVVICLCFHAVFENSADSKSGLILPQQGITCDDYRLIFDHFLEQNYQFISYSMLNGGLKPGGKYIYVTFDDGYFNNSKLAGILGEYKIPIHLFVITQNILTGNRFWWDIMFNEGTKRRWSEKKISREISYLKTRPTKETEAYITSLFGEESHKPLSDLDRPYTMQELINLEKCKRVTVGNHTNDHTGLEIVQMSEAMAKVEIAQETLGNYLGERPTSFAFPYGNFNDKLILELSKNKMKHIFTLESGRNKLRRRSQSRECNVWGRFCFEKNISVERQCKMFRAANVSLNVMTTRITNFVEKRQLRANHTRQRIAS